MAFFGTRSIDNCFPADTNRKEVKFPTLCLKIPVIAAGQHLSIQVDDKVRKAKRGEIKVGAVYGYFPPIINIVCDEGSAVTTAIPLRDTKSEPSPPNAGDPRGTGEAHFK